MASSLPNESLELARRAGAECKSLRQLINGNLATLSHLNTAEKSNLVAAINEVLAAALTPSATTFAELTDKSDVDLPAINTPLATALASKAPTSHTHTASQISDSTTTGRALLTAVDAAAARTTIGATVTGSALITAANAANARSNALGSGATGDQLFTALTPAAARVVLEINRTRVTQALDLASASLTFANTDLVLTLEGGVDYLIRGVFDMFSAASNTGFKLQLTTSQNMNVLAASGGCVGWVAGSAGLAQITLLTLQRSDFFNLTGGPTTRRVHVEMRLNLVATGTVRIAFAQNALGAAPDSLFKAGSWLASERL